MQFYGKMKFMKVWIKYLIGVVIGLACALILPVDNPSVSGAISFILDIFIRFGRYIVVPMIFFSGVIAVNRLRSSKLILKTSLWTGLIIVASSLILTLAGVLSIVIVKLPRIPITVDQVTDTYTLGIGNMIRSLFPASAFEAVLEGSFLLVPFLLAFLVGWESSVDETVFRPVLTLMDSLSKLVYGISVFFTEVMSVGMIAIMCNWTITFRSVWTTGIYTPMFIMFIVDFVLIVGIIYPVILYYVCHDPHPYRILFASLTSLFTSFFSGDTNLTLPLNIRHGKESLGIRRRVSGFTYPLFSIFARGGSALVVVISFVVIWRSYSSLAISFKDVLWISGSAFGLSFLLGGLPSGSSFVLLAILCTTYSKGFETSFLLLKPAAPIICSFAALFDAATAMFGSYIVAVKTKMIEHHNLAHFI